MKRWIRAWWQIRQKIGPIRRVPNPDLGSQLEDLRIHVRWCERWAQLDDRLDYAFRTSRRRQ